VSRDIFNQTRLLRALSNLALNVSRDGASTASLGNLFQCFTTLIVKKFFLISSLSSLLGDPGLWGAVQADQLSLACMVSKWERFYSTFLQMPMQPLLCEGQQIFSGLHIFVGSCLRSVKIQKDKIALLYLINKKMQKEKAFSLPVVLLA